MTIPFNRPCTLGNELQYVATAIKEHKLSGDGSFTNRCHQWFQNKTGCKKALLAHSGTAALEMAAILADIQPGDEVIMPSYTFVSTANAFVLRGGIPVFVDIRPDTMNINETKIESAITSQTKAIVPVHYAGVACEMDRIMDIAARYNLLVIEDAAQGVTSTYKGQQLGAVGHLGCYSFHETKNYTCGEGGALIINDERFIERAEVIREKGTNRSKFFRGQVDKYTWVDIGSSYLPSELNAAYLLAQLEQSDTILQDRLDSWNYYYEKLTPLARTGLIDIPVIPQECSHNAHMFYIKVKDLSERTKLISFLNDNDVHSVFHYIPLHSAPAGRQFGSFFGEDKYTTIESERLIRLPLYFGLTKDDIEKVAYVINGYFDSRDRDES
jgi:dTDP-4-amino-4,6-dideoxygalactose transaminase